MTSLANSAIEKHGGVWFFWHRRFQAQVSTDNAAQKVFIRLDWILDFGLHFGNKGRV